VVNKEDLNQEEKTVMRTVMLKKELAALVIVCGVAMSLSGLFSGDVYAGAVRTNVTGFTAHVLAANDDSSVGPVSLGFQADFFGLSFSNLFVNNNGNVTITNALSAYTPFALSSNNIPIIAPFFGDVDTRVAYVDTRAVVPGVVTYGNDTVDGHLAFGVNWIDVGYFSYGTDKLNSFQLVVIDRSDVAAGDFDFELNYDKIQWEAGSASGGTNGLGGTSARAGYANGSGSAGTYYELNGSAVNGAFLDSNTATGLIYHSLNSSQLGRYLFQVRGGTVIGTGDCSLAAVIALIQQSYMTRSQKASLINAVTTAYRIANVVKCRALTVRAMERSLARHMHKSARLGRLDTTIAVQILACINQFIGSCVLD
jgi:hypothetical protein